MVILSNASFFNLKLNSEKSNAIKPCKYLPIQDFYETYFHSGEYLNRVQYVLNTFLPEMFDIQRVGVTSCGNQEIKKILQCCQE